MLKDLRICLRGGRPRGGLPVDGLRTWPLQGEPVLRLAAPMEVLRGGGSIEPNDSTSAIGDTLVVSIRLGVDEHVRPAEATFPN